MSREKKYQPVPFDTLSYAKKLKAVGFTEEQAEVQAETFMAIVQEQLVSKRDLKEVEKSLRVEIEKVRSDLSLEITNVHKDLKTSMELLRRDLKIWFGGMLVVAVSVVSAIVTLLPRIAH